MIKWKTYELWYFVSCFVSILIWYWTKRKHNLLYVDTKENNQVKSDNFAYPNWNKQYQNCSTISRWKLFHKGQILE